jgi:hypothetical protein
MSKLLGAARTIAFICLLSFPLRAGDIAANVSDTPPRFALFTPDPAASQQKSGQASPANAGPQILSPEPAIAWPAPLSGSEKWKYYIRSTYGPISVGSSLLLAGIKQAQASVPEWGGGMEGYGKRFGSSFGQKAISRSIRIGLNSLLREDPRYLPSGRTGYLNRTIYAVEHTFLARKDAGGNRIAFSRFAGTFGAACIAKQWYPESYRTVSECLTSGVVSLGLDSAKSVFYEFWPDVRKRLRH